MTNVLILGANGRIARFVVASLSKQSDISQTLLVRDASKLAEVPDNARVITADVLDTAALTDAVRGQDIVYANLTGDDIDEQAQSVVAAMDSAGVPRLIFVLALGIYGEVPGAFGEWNDRMIGTELRVFAKAAEVLEAPTSTTRSCGRPGSTTPRTPRMRSPSKANPSRHRRRPAGRR